MKRILSEIKFGTSLEISMEKIEKEKEILQQSKCEPIKAQ